MRWGLGGAILGAVVLETVLFAVGLPDLQDGESELNIFVTRSAYFAVAATMLGYFGAYRERSRQRLAQLADWPFDAIAGNRSEEHTSELQSLMRISYAVFCLKNKTKTRN